MFWCSDGPEDQVICLFTGLLANPEVSLSLGLNLAKVSDMRIFIPLDLSSRSFIPLPCFLRSRHPTTLLAPSLVFPPQCSA
jgi:hypothetical protein